MKSARFNTAPENSIELEYGSDAISLQRYVADFQSGLTEPGYLKSHLTGSSYPLEISFTSTNMLPRYTLDHFCHTLPVEQRLPATLKLLNDDFKQSLPASTRAALQKLQQGELHYGAWLGLRADELGCTGKIYCEVSCEAELDPAWQQLSDALPHSKQLRMLGIDLRHNTAELYFRCADLTPELFAPMLAPIGRFNDVGYFISAIEAAYGYKLDGRFPGGNIGVSYSIDASGKPVSITLYLYCRSFWGRDQSCRVGFSKLLASRNMSPEQYRQVTKDLVFNSGAQTQHGMLGFSFGSAGQVEYGIGFCPYNGGHS